MMVMRENKLIVVEKPPIENALSIRMFKTDQTIQKRFSVRKTDSDKK